MVKKIKRKLKSGNKTKQYSLIKREKVWAKNNLKLRKKLEKEFNVKLIKFRGKK